MMSDVTIYWFLDDVMMSYVFGICQIFIFLHFSHKFKLVRRLVNLVMTYKSFIFAPEFLKTYIGTVRQEI